MAKSAKPAGDLTTAEIKKIVDELVVLREKLRGLISSGSFRLFDA